MRLGTLVIQSTLIRLLDSRDIAYKVHNSNTRIYLDGTIKKTELKMLIWKFARMFKLGYSTIYRKKQKKDEHVIIKMWSL